MNRALLALLFAACSTERTTPPPPPPAPVVAAAPSNVITLDGPSIYDLETPLADANARPIKLDVDRGHVTVIAMFYASCAVACPVTIADIKQTLDALPADVQDDVRVLLVSFDPARDTPAVLTAIGQQHHLDGRWTLAVPSETDARTLAATIGVKYRKLDDGQFAHNVAITVLDGEGRPIARAEQFGQYDALARIIAAAMQARPNT